MFHFQLNYFRPQSFPNIVQRSELDFPGVNKTEIFLKRPMISSWHLDDCHRMTIYWRGYRWTQNVLCDWIYMMVYKASWWCDDDTTWKYCEVTARTSLCAGTIMLSSQTRLTSAKRLVRLAKRRASKDDNSVSPPLQSPITKASLSDLGGYWDLLILIKQHPDLISWSLTLILLQISSRYKVSIVEMKFK